MERASELTGVWTPEFCIHGHPVGPWWKREVGRGLAYHLGPAVRKLREGVRGIKPQRSSGAEPGPGASRHFAATCKIWVECLSPLPKAPLVRTGGLQMTCVGFWGGARPLAYSGLLWPPPCREPLGP